MRPSVMVICGCSTIRPVSTSIIRSALTTTVSAKAAVSAASASAAPATIAAQRITLVFIYSSPFRLLSKLSQGRCCRFHLGQQDIESRRLRTAHRGKGYDVLEDMLHIAARFVVGDVFNPNIGVHGLRRQPSHDGRRTCVVGGETHIELFSIAIQQFTQVSGSQWNCDRRIKQAVTTG